MGDYTNLLWDWTLGLCGPRGLVFLGISGLPKNALTSATRAMGMVMLVVVRPVAGRPRFFLVGVVLVAMAVISGGLMLDGEPIIRKFSKSRKIGMQKLIPARSLGRPIAKNATRGAAYRAPT